MYKEMSQNHKVADMIKPNSTINFTKIQNLVNRSTVTNETYSPSTNKYPEKISLLQFSRLYKIGGIPILDFVITYILLYILNATYLKLDYALILVATIPITIFFEMLTNKELNVTFMIILILVLSTMYVLISLPDDFYKHLGKN
jgi:hypothetical protein